MIDEQHSPFREVTVTLRAYEWANILERVDQDSLAAWKLRVAFMKENGWRA